MARKTKNKRYTDELKNQIIDECLNDTVYAVGKRHGIAETTIKAWIKKYEAAQSVIKKHNIPSVPAIRNDNIEDAIEVLDVREQCEDVEEKENFIIDMGMQRLKYIMATSKRGDEVTGIMKYLEERQEKRKNAGDIGHNQYATIMQRLYKKIDEQQG